MLIAYLFSIYIDIFGGFSMYGSLTTIVVMLIWLYYNMYIIILGAIINQFFGTFLAYVKIINSNRRERRAVNERRSGHDRRSGEITADEEEDTEKGDLAASLISETSAVSEFDDTCPITEIPETSSEI